MKRLAIPLALMAMSFFGTSAVTACELKSGPEVGKRIPGIFRPIAVHYAANPELNGESINPACHYGPNPTAMLFVRDTSPALADLVKQLDAAAVKHKDARLGVCVVLLTDDEAKTAEKKLRDLKEQTKAERVTFATFPSAGPEAYGLAKGAEWTVLLYRKYLVAVNHAVCKNDLDAKLVDKVLADLGRIVE